MERKEEMRVHHQYYQYHHSSHKHQIFGGHRCEKVYEGEEVYNGREGF